MRLIAKRNFRNTQRALTIPDAIHPDHVHKGARFTVGSADTPYADLKPAERQLVGLLNVADCIGDASNPKIVAQVEADVAADKARLKK